MEAELKIKRSAVLGLEPNTKPHKQTQNYEPDYSMCQTLEDESSVLDSSCGPLCPHLRLLFESVNFGFQVIIHNIYKSARVKLICF